jgi:hypothetical protein
MEVQKKFEICGVLKKESRFTGRTSHQADQHGYLPEVKVKISEQMPDQIINSSARSAVTKKLGLNPLLAEDLSKYKSVMISICQGTDRGQSKET